MLVRDFLFFVGFWSSKICGEVLWGFRAWI